MRKRNRKDDRRAFCVGDVGSWRRRWRGVGLASLGVLVGVGVVVGNPVVDVNEVMAKEDPTTEPDGTKVELNTTQPAQSEVTLTMDSGGTNGKLNASAAGTNPDAAADVVKRTATVGLTNTDGYVVNIKANSTNLTGTNTSNTIASVSANSTLGQMTNTWGWNGSVGDAVADCNPSEAFKPMKTTDQQLGTGGAISATQNKKVTMCFGSRIDGSKTADTYTNTVTLSVVAQPGKTATFGGKTTMQEITPAICSAASINDTAYLRDTRDNKYYWVTKLLDDNCWMSQNLDLDLSTSKPLTSDTSATAWTPGQDTQTSVTVGSTSYTETYSWDLGQYVINAPTATTACANNATGLASCTMFTAVGSRTASTDPNFYKNTTYKGTDGTTNCTKTANTSISTTTSGVCAQYDAHYLVGNYYQWNAATAGTGGSITNANASGSICPKGWKLPNSAIDANTITKGTYAYLLQQYGLVTAYNTGTITGTSGVNGNTYNIALSPLFLVRGGDIYLGNATTPFQDAGVRGYYWSSRAGSNTTIAYYLLFSTNVRPSSSASNRYYGVPLRCLIPTP